MTEVCFTGQSGATWRYWTDRRLGAGFFGTVYAGEGSDETPVAVKVVQKERLHDVIGDRLLRREVEIGRQVTDSGGDMLLPVIDVAETDKALLLVVPRADGTLAEAAMPMDDSTVTSVMKDIASGLQQLHAIGIIHRDLKPANVLRHQRRWKLADFGIARDQEIGTQDLTFIGWGSHQYMAPEIWEMKSPTVKSDLYALGCIAFELVAGYALYPGDREIARMGHLTQPPPDVPTTNPIIRGLITRLIAKVPGERPQDARAVLDRLQRATLSANDTQQAIAESLARYAQDRGSSAATASAAQEAAVRRRQQAAQAKAELYEILSDAAQDLQHIAPEIKVHPRVHSASAPFGTGAHIKFGELSVPEARLEVYIQDDDPERLPGDDLKILVGCTFITNQYFTIEEDEYLPDHERPHRPWMHHRMPDGFLSANIAYEPIGNRLGWRVYRFRGLGPFNPKRSEFTDDIHGIDCEKFRMDAYIRFAVPMELFDTVASVAPLTVDTLISLFQEAIDIRRS